MIQLWGNDEMLPTETSRQKALYVSLPRFYFWGLEINTKVGYNKKVVSNHYDGLGVRKFNLVILGFGFIYTENWDV